MKECCHFSFSLVYFLLFYFFNPDATWWWNDKTLFMNQYWWNFHAANWMTHVTVLNDVGNVILMLATVETICPKLAHMKSLTVFNSQRHFPPPVYPPEAILLWPFLQTFNAKRVQMSYITWTCTVSFQTAMLNKNVRLFCKQCREPAVFWESS